MSLSLLFLLLSLSWEGVVSISIGIGTFDAGVTDRVAKGRGGTSAGPTGWDGCDRAKTMVSKAGKGTVTARIT